jgi:hypothetical protein
MVKPIPPSRSEVMNLNASSLQFLARRAGASSCFPLDGMPTLSIAMYAQTTHRETLAHRAIAKGLVDLPPRAFSASSRSPPASDFMIRPCLKRAGPAMMTSEPMTDATQRRSDQGSSASCALLKHSFMILDKLSACVSALEGDVCVKRNFTTVSLTIFGRATANESKIANEKPERPCAAANLISRDVVRRADRVGSRRCSENAGRYEVGK